MSDSKELGKQGENIASAFLREKGYKILSRNFKMGKNEIDIIAEKENIIIFIEVKTRSENYLEHPHTAVMASKQKAIIMVADQYLRKYNVDKDSRFDIITIIKNNDEFEIAHIENAFYPTLK